MNKFIEVYQRGPDEILEFVNKVSTKEINIETVSDFCDAEYQFFPTFKYRREILDVCGTGGAKYNTINVGTISSFVLASLGIPVAKLSFPSYSGSVGSADILNTYEIPIRTSQNEIFRDLDKFNLSFLQREYNPEGLRRNRKTAKISVKMHQKSVFRLLGPLCHPLKPKFRIYGLSENKNSQVLSKYLTRNTKGNMVVFGKTGIDEIDVCAQTDIWENGRQYSLDIEEIGLKKVSMKDIEIDSSRGEKIFIEILENRATKHFIDLVLINVAAGIKVVKGIDWEKGYKIAEDELKSGRPLEIFKKMRALS